MQKSIQEIFRGIPTLLALFQEYERELVRAQLEIHKKGVDAERVAARNDVLLQVAQSITACELKLLYYLRNTEGIRAEALLHEIKKIYRAQCAFKNEIDGGEREDILQLVKKKACAKGDNRRKFEENA